MARHEFGVMPLAPGAGQRFEKYEPGKYRCTARAGDYAIPVSH